MFRSYNIQALQCAMERNLGFTGGSDGHVIYELGMAITVSDSSDVDGLLKSIKDKRNKVIGKEKILPEKFLMSSTSAIRFITRYPISGAAHKIYSITHHGSVKDD